MCVVWYGVQPAALVPQANLHVLLDTAERQQSIWLKQRLIKHMDQADTLGCTCFASLHSAPLAAQSQGLAKLFMQDADRVKAKAAGISHWRAWQ